MTYPGIEGEAIAKKANPTKKNGNVICVPFQENGIPCWIRTSDAPAPKAGDLTRLAQRDMKFTLSHSFPSCQAK